MNLMALDLYTGCFSRYFAREWENVVQRHAREQGLNYQQISPHGPIQKADWDEVTQMTEEWRQAMNEGLGSNLEQPLTWREDRETPYFTDRPGYDSYGALMLWAAYMEGDMTPPTAFVDPWYDDPVLQKYSNAENAPSLGPLMACSLWLPGDFHFSYEFSDLTGQTPRITSNEALRWTLEKIEHGGLSPSPTMGDAPGSSEPPSLKFLAEIGLSVFQQICAKSIEHHLPIILDT
jgi:hypothetical protein